MTFFKKIRGFTILELIVAIAVFSILTTLATGGFVRALKTERQISAYTAVNSNVGLFLEQIAREARTGSNFCINGNSCPSSSILSFLNASGENVTYCLESGAIKRSIGSGCSSGQNITGDNVSVENLRFILFGNQNGDGYPPRVTILVGATSRLASALSYKVNLQTTVSSRILGE